MEHRGRSATKPIEYFYSSHSSFAYLGSRRFMEIATAAGRSIVHRPMDLNRVIAAAHGSAFGAHSPAHRAYFFGREIERWSEYRNAPVCSLRPTHHDNDLALSSGLLIACDRAGFDVDALAHAVLEAHWRDDADLADHDTLAGVARGIGIDPEPLLDRALAPDVQAVYEANTADAIRRSVFGSPTYFVDGDMFYGQDRLDLVERALQRPFAETAPGR